MVSPATCVLTTSSRAQVYPLFFPARPPPTHILLLLPLLLVHTPLPHPSLHHRQLYNRSPHHQNSKLCSPRWRRKRLFASWALRSGMPSPVALRLHLSVLPGPQLEVRTANLNLQTEQPADAPDLVIGGSSPLPPPPSHLHPPSPPFPLDAYICVYPSLPQKTKN